MPSDYAAGAGCVRGAAGGFSPARRRIMPGEKERYGLNSAFLLEKARRRS